jgi:hypothetical protein
MRRGRLGKHARPRQRYNYQVAHTLFGVPCAYSMSAYEELTQGLIRGRLFWEVFCARRDSAFIQLTHDASPKAVRLLEEQQSRGCFSNRPRFLLSYLCGVRRMYTCMCFHGFLFPTTIELSTSIPTLHKLPGSDLQQQLLVQQHVRHCYCPATAAYGPRPQPPAAEDGGGFTQLQP